jgi:hypothetical protein
VANILLSSKITEECVSFIKVQRVKYEISEYERMVAAVIWNPAHFDISTSRPFYSDGPNKGESHGLLRHPLTIFMLDPELIAPT